MLNSEPQTYFVTSETLSQIPDIITSFLLASIEKYIFEAEVF